MNSLCANGKYSCNRNLRKESKFLASGETIRLRDILQHELLQPGHGRASCVTFKLALGLVAPLLVLPNFQTDSLALRHWQSFVLHGPGGFSLWKHNCGNVAKRSQDNFAQTIWPFFLGSTFGWLYSTTSANTHAKTCLYFCRSGN